MRLLDLFCGEGGGALGYYLAGFTKIVGVDHKPMPRYPYKLVKDDAIMFLRENWAEFDAIHASPPCQGYSENLKHLAKPAKKLIEPLREVLENITIPWVIENVEGAPLETEDTLFGGHGTMLCGTMFGLKIWRHRLFESSVRLESPGPCLHILAPLNPHREESRQRMRKEFGQVDLEKVWRAEAGVPWMSKEGGRQAIPPVYTKWIGTQLLRSLGGERTFDA
jgi:DNA (cytosine-5)-methyltransferase 1